MKTKVNVGLVQMSCTANPDTNLTKAALRIREAAQKRAQIICLQEMYRTLYFCQTEDYAVFDLAEPLDGPSFKAFSPLAQELGVVIIAPIFEKRAPGVYHNSALVIDADGSMAGVYRKMHIPDDPGFYEKFYFAPGDLGFRAFDTRYGRVGVLICWDQWYPEAARLTAMQGAQIIFYPTAIGWDVNEPKAYGMSQTEAWETMQRSHSIANGVFVCAVNRTGKEGDLDFWGNSFVYNPFGQLLGKTTHEREEILIAECDLSQQEYYRRRWPFLRDRRIDAYSDMTKRYSNE